MKIFLHTKRTEEGEWDNNKVIDGFTRIPIVGEYLTLGSTATWYQVLLVVHTPFQDADTIAELYATEVNSIDIVSRISN